MQMNLSPLMQQVEAHVRATVPDVEITDPRFGDSFFVRGSIDNFSVGPLQSTGAPAAWPIYVHPTQSLDTYLECEALDHVTEALRWPLVAPTIRTLTLVEAREKAADLALARSAATGV